MSLTINTDNTYTVHPKPVDIRLSVADKEVMYALLQTYPEGGRVKAVRYLRTAHGRHVSMYDYLSIVDHYEEYIKEDN